MLPAALFSRCSSIGPGGFFLHNEPLNEFAGQGSMPQGGGCTGNPALDAAKPQCLTAAEQSTLQAWITGGQLP